MTSTIRLAILALSILLGVALALPTKYFRYTDTIIDSPAIALRHLRTFTPQASSLERKCSLISATLQQLGTTGSVSLFWIHQLAKKRNQLVDNIPQETLSVFYLGALRDFLVGDKLDASIGDVFECAKRLYHDSNLKVRNALKEKDLLDAVAQWRSITEQKSAFFSEPDFKHPNLKYEDLVEPVRLSLLTLFRNNEAQLKSRFFSAEQEAAKSRTLEEIVAHTKSMVDKFYNSILKNEERWSNGNLCRAYSGFTDAASGDMSESDALQLAQRVQISIEMNGKSDADFKPNEQSVNNLVDVAHAILEREPEDELWQGLTDCIQTQSQFPRAEAFLNSEILRRQIEVLEKAQAQPLDADQDDSDSDSEDSDDEDNEEEDDDNDQDQDIEDPEDPDDHEHNDEAKKKPQHSS